MKEKHIVRVALVTSFTGILSLLIASVMFSTGMMYKEGPFNVTYVVDGDTLDLSNGDRIRLSGIDTPEKGACYSAAAQQYLAKLVLSKEVYLESDITDEGKYGRKLRYVYVDDVLANGLIVENGYGKVYDKYNATTKRYSQLKELEVNARENEIGVWGCVEEDCMYIKSVNSNIYHKPECKGAKRIKPENRICITSEEDLVGLSPAKSC